MRFDSLDKFFFVIIRQVRKAVIIFLETDECYIKTPRTVLELKEHIISEFCHNAWELLTAHTH